MPTARPAVQSQSTREPAPDVLSGDLTRPRRQTILAHPERSTVAGDDGALGLFSSVGNNRDSQGT